jgi:hypothetical protein
VIDDNVDIDSEELEVDLVVLDDELLLIEELDKLDILVKLDDDDE